MYKKKSQEALPNVLNLLIMVNLSSDIWLHTNQSLADVSSDGIYS